MLFLFLPDQLGLSRLLVDQEGLCCNMGEGEDDGEVSWFKERAGSSGRRWRYHILSM